ncbi:hypothetical protein KCP73_02695 [Salmonella enterica subsp. enterica]|nr:hypothetical protein KCP73_02695 [Salmonella enterica subsp. enterica]
MSCCLDRWLTADGCVALDKGKCVDVWLPGGAQSTEPEAAHWYLVAAQTGIAPGFYTG